MRRYSSRRATRYSSSSSSSSSSSDECAAQQPANKLERLRRIFLSQPSKSDGREGCASVAASRSPQRKTRTRSPVARHASESPDRLRSRHSSSVSASRRPLHSGHEKDEDIGGSTDGESAKQTQLSIDSHIHSLCEHVKRMTVQRESTANQMHEMLDQAIEELQFLKKQEERSLQSLRVDVVDCAENSNFSLRLEVFEQQYLAKVAEIQREMQTAIQQRRARAEATILAAAKQLQEKTQCAVLPDPSLIANRGSFAATTSAANSVENQPNRSSVPIRLDDHRSRSSMDALDALASNVGARQPPRAMRKQSQSCHEVGGENADSELSPVDKQKAKLRALEAKLVLFSQDSVDRIATELKSGAASAQADNAGSKTWKPTPLSPLRKNRSYWRRGISLETNNERDDWDTAANGEAQRGGERRRSAAAAAGALSSRFLRPEEEQELRHLRDSIGLAKDWMERHH